MKKIRIILAIILIATFSVLLITKESTSKNISVDKQISLAIFAGNNYTSEAYNDALATVEVTVTEQTGIGQNIVWKKEFSDLALKDYPAFQNALTQKVTIPNVIENKERLMVNYTITYNTGGSILQLSGDSLVPAGSTTQNLCINV